MANFDPTDFTLPSGEVVQMRGLNGIQGAVATKKASDPVDRTAFLLACSMGMKESEAKAWMESHTAGDMFAALTHANDLSGMGDDATKSGVDPVPGEPD